MPTVTKRLLTEAESRSVTTVVASSTLEETPSVKVLTTRSNCPFTMKVPVEEMVP